MGLYVRVMWTSL